MNMVRYMFLILGSTEIIRIKVGDFPRGGTNRRYVYILYCIGGRRIIRAQYGRERLVALGFPPSPSLLSSQFLSL